VVISPLPTDQKEEEEEEGEKELAAL